MTHEVTITVSGPVGSGKSAICGEIEILCKALGLQVEWVGGQQEKNLTHADWTEALEMYKPSVAIIEQLASCPAADESAKPDERAAFETKFPVPSGVKWDGNKYAVDDEYINSYVCDRFVGRWDAWQAASTAGKKAVTLSELSVERRAELFDHMLAVAQANGFESITAAIAQAVKAPESFDAIDKQISYVAKLARRDGAAGDKTGQFDIAFERLRTMVRGKLAQCDSSKETVLSDEQCATLKLAAFEIARTSSLYLAGQVTAILAQRDASKAEPKS